jgi:siroheme synthase (precorrin-2 oxidase/ferrochelatase)
MDQEGSQKKVARFWDRFMKNAEKQSVNEKRHEKRDRSIFEREAKVLIHAPLPH